MPPLEVADLYQKAVLREKSGQDEHNEPTTSDPVEISCRWVDEKRQVVAPDSSLIDIDCTVYVNRDVKVGSLIWLGTLEDWLGTGSGVVDSLADVMEVVFIRKTPDTKGRAIRRELLAKRFRDTLPEIA